MSLGKSDIGDFEAEDHFQHTQKYDAFNQVTRGRKSLLSQEAPPKHYQQQLCEHMIWAL